jgi:hypothetical protein
LELAKRTIGQDILELNPDELISPRNDIVLNKFYYMDNSSEYNSSSDDEYHEEEDFEEVDPLKKLQTLEK